MKIIDKLTLGHLTVGLLVIVVALVGINAINSINLAFNEITGETQPTIKSLDDVKEASLRIVVSTSEFVSLKAESGVNETAIGVVEKERVLSGIKQYDAAISNYEDLVNKFFPQEKGFLANIKNSGKKLKNASNELIILKEQGASGSIVLEKQDEFEAAEQEFLKAINDAIAFEDKEFADRNQAVAQTIATSLTYILIVGLLTFITAIALGVIISKSISNPIIKLKNAAIDIGKGKLDTRVDIKNSDEVGILAACFNQMAQRLEHDIEELNNVETVVRESEEKFRLVFENARDAIFWSDPETGLILRCNKAAENLLEKENREIVGHHQSTVHSPDKAQFYADQFKRHFQERGSLDDDAEVLTKSGKIKHVQISASVTTVRRKPIMQGIFHDITERKLAEKALIKEKEFTEIALDSQLDTFFVFDPFNHKAIRWNKTFRDITGYTDEEIASLKAPDSYYSPQDLEKAAFAKEYLMRIGKARVELSLICKNGHTILTEYEASLIRDENGEPKYVISVGRDITERNRAEEMVKESEERHRRLVDFSPYGIAIHSEGKLVFVNQAGAKILGAANPEELFGIPVLQIIHQDYRDLVKERIRMQEEGKAAPLIEEKFIRLDGTFVDVELAAIPFTYKGKLAMYGVFMDITERKQAEDALRRSERDLKESQRVAQVGSWQWIIASDTITWSPGYYRIIGRDLALPPPNYKEHLKMYTEESAGRLEAAVSDALKNGTAYELDLELLHPDGSQRFMIARGEAVRDAAGQVVMLRGTLQDITQRKRAEEAQKKSEQRYRILAEGAHDSIFIIERNNRIRYLNSFGAKQLGLMPEEIMGRRLIEFFPIEQFERMKNNLQKVFQTGEPLSIEDTLTYQNRKHWEDTWLMPIKDTAGEVDAVMGITRDITDRKLAEEELKKHRDHLEELVNERTNEVRHAKEEAERANMAKTNFLQTMSHELRTPLNAILGFSEILKQKTPGELNEKQEHFIDNIITSGNNLHNIIGQILDIVQMDAGTIELHIEKIPVPETVDEFIGLIKEKAAIKNVLIEKNLDPELEYIEADKQKFRQIFFNLLDNAVKFSKEEGGTVTITGKKEGDMAKFSVSDRGIGIRKENVGKLFQEFTQLDTGTTRKYGGTGLGLAITRQHVEQHGGKIWAESKYGEGTTFTFTLPLNVNKE
ncbi:MAG: PAS domain S-box protein [Candidatus Methanoperedens sp.]|nr:PAS domain S-box protein [Candidatus Methanoperedens sp.]